MIIDTHAHIIDSYHGYSGRGEVRPDGFGRLRHGNGDVHRSIPPTLIDTTFPPEILIEYMNDAGVDKALLLQNTYYGLMNDYVASAARTWPTRFLGVACVDPYAKYRQKILSHCVEDLGLRGVKFEMSEDYGLTGFHPYLRLNDSELDPLWSQMTGYGIPLILDPGWSYEKGNRPSDMRQVIESHPELTVVVCHLGQPTHSVIQDIAQKSKADPSILVSRNFEVADDSFAEWLSLGSYPNVYYDLAIVHLFAGREEYPFPVAQAYVRYAKERVGADRLMWGTDVPSGLMLGAYEDLLNWLRKHCDFLTEAEREAVLGKTALRVFGFK